MELLETQDPEKKRLIETSDRHKRALEKSLTDMTQKTDRMLMNALIIGKKKKRKLAKEGAVKTAEGTTTVDEVEEDDGISILGSVSSRVINMGTVILLDIAREKIAEYLANRDKKDDHS
jgi:hypothetical protein